MCESTLKIQKKRGLKGLRPRIRTNYFQGNPLVFGHLMTFFFINLSVVQKTQFKQKSNPNQK